MYYELIFGGQFDNSGQKSLKISDGLEFMYDHTGVSAVKYNGSTYIYRKNAQNDIIALLDTSGKVVVKYYYDAWGNTITEVLDQAAYTVANLNPFRYRSYYYDTETELYYLQSRYYDPEVGRFINGDDGEITSLSPHHLFAYAGNNPVNETDSSGKLLQSLLFKLFAGVFCVL